MFMTQNYIHTSSSVEDANNEIDTYLDQYKVNKQRKLAALKSHAMAKKAKTSNSSPMIK